MENLGIGTVWNLIHSQVVRINPLAISQVRTQGTRRSSNRIRNKLGGETRKRIDLAQILNYRARFITLWAWMPLVTYAQPVAVVANR